jgi:hypothetical protein
VTRDAQNHHSGRNSDYRSNCWRLVDCRKPKAAGHVGAARWTVGMDTKASILHADLDAFYASVEQLHSKQKPAGTW